MSREACTLSVYAKKMWDHRAYFFPENPFLCVNIRVQNINFEFERSIIILDDFSHIL